MGQLRDPTGQYLSEIGISPLLTAAEERSFARRALRGDEAASQRMIESNGLSGDVILDYALTITKRQRPGGLHPQER